MYRNSCSHSMKVMVGYSPIITCSITDSRRNKAVIIGWRGEVLDAQRRRYRQSSQFSTPYDAALITSNRLAEYILPGWRIS